MSAAGPESRAPVWTGLTLSALALGVLARFIFLDSYPWGIWSDEAYNGYDALRTLSEDRWQVFYPDNNGREGGLIWLIALSVSLLDTTILALRLPSAAAGALTLLAMPFAMYQLMRFFGPEADAEAHRSAVAVALLGAVFLALSHWHLMLSRIAFRAVLDPLFAALALGTVAFALRHSRRWPLAVLAGLACGAGVYGYASHKFLLVPLALLCLFALARDPVRHLLPVAVAAATALVVAAPWMVFFLTDAQAAFERASQVSVFATESPPAAALRSSLLLLQMFFGMGDLNIRHNFPGQPMLNPIVFVFFAIGALTLVARLRPSATAGRGLSLVLLSWLIAGLVPAALTFPYQPHALRAVGALLPALAISAFGAWIVLREVSALPVRSSAVHLFSAVLVISLAGHSIAGYFLGLPRQSTYAERFQVARTAAAMTLAGMRGESARIVLPDSDPVINTVHFRYFGWDRLVEGDASFVELGVLEQRIPDATGTLFVPSEIIDDLAPELAPGARVLTY